MKKFLSFFLALLLIPAFACADTVCSFGEIYRYKYAIPKEYTFLSEEKSDKSITYNFSVADNPNATGMVNVTMVNETSVAALTQESFNDIARKNMPGSILYLDTVEKNGMLMCAGGGSTDGVHYCMLMTACTDSLMMLFFSDTKNKNMPEEWKDKLVMLSEHISYGDPSKPNLSSMSYEELVALKDEINLAIWKSKEWQEVEVPHGVWVVGKDIPAGKWTISVAKDKTARVDWGDKLDPSGWDFEWGTIWVRQFLDGENAKYRTGNFPSSITFELKDGHYIIVQEGTVYFTPYSGKTSLGFK